MDYNLLASSLTHLEQYSFRGTQLERIRALEAATRLQARLETPWEGLIRKAWFEVPLASSLKIALDLKVFSALGVGTLHISRLASETGCDEQLLRRILRQLASHGFIHESADESYSLTRLSAAYAADASMTAGIEYMFDVLLPAHIKLPACLAEIGYRNPTHNEVWRSVIGEEKTFYEWLEGYPEKAANFQKLLSGYSTDRPTWVDFYPTDELLTSWREGTPLIVDVGGGTGEDLIAFVKVHKDAIRGDLVLQDLPHSIELARKELEPPITAMAHDFFTPQPVVGARVYHLHLVLFNWPDSKAVEILRNIKPALTPGYSKILINDNVCVPGASSQGASSMDIVMMSVFNSKVRTKPEWEQLVHDAGLVIERFWSVPEVPENIIEVSLPA